MAGVLQGEGGRGRSRRGFIEEDEEGEESSTRSLRFLIVAGLY
jgi:hypothetical protein